METTSQIQSTNSYSTLYHLTPRALKRPLRVCFNFFVKALGVSRDRVNLLCKKNNKGEVIKDRRGDDRVSHKSQAKKKKIIDFIGNLKGRERHYNR